MSLADVEEAWREVASAAGASSSMVEKWMTKLATRKSIVRQITTYRRLIEPRLSPEIRVQFLLAVFFKGVETSPGASDAASALPEVEDSLVLLENFFSEAGIDDVSYLFKNLVHL